MLGADTPNDNRITNNLIGWNALNGIMSHSGQRNSFQANTFVANGGVGIKLGTADLSNDVDDVDQGPNNLQNHPEIESIQSADNGDVAVEFTVSTAASSAVYPLLVEFYEADATGRQGQTLLAVTAYEQPGASMTTLLPANLVNDTSLVVATATDSLGNTSEFSPSFELPPVDNVPPEITNVRVNQHVPGSGNELPNQPTNWAQQRSELRSIAVDFSEPVMITANDVRLMNLGLDGDWSEATEIAVDSEQLQIVDSQLVLHFAPDALEDGVYAIEFLGNVTDAAGNSLETGDNANWVVGSADNGLYQLTADFNGDGGVSILDFSALAFWFGATDDAPGFVDLNRDGGVSIFDFPVFAFHFLNNVTFPTTAPPAAKTLSNDSVAESWNDAAVDEVLSDWTFSTVSAKRDF